MANPKSAKLGSVTFAGGAIADCTDIQLAKTANEKPYASSSTAGQMSRRAGHQDQTGTFTLLQDALSFDEGDSGTLVLKSDAAVEIFNATAFISDISYSVPIQAGDLVEATVTFGQQPT